MKNTTSIDVARGRKGSAKTAVNPKGSLETEDQEADEHHFNE